MGNYWYKTFFYIFNYHSKLNIVENNDKYKLLSLKYDKQQNQIQTLKTKIQQKDNQLKQIQNLINEKNKYQQECKEITIKYNDLKKNY